MNNSSISYLVTCKNEGSDLERLLKSLYAAITGTNDEIVIIDDNSSDDYTRKLLAFHPLFSTSSSLGRVYKHMLDGDFSSHKNFGNSKCEKSWICQLDADEYLATPLISNLHEIIEYNPSVELYWVPRINIVRGTTPEDAQKWGWNVSSLPEFNGLPIINWASGDYQGRIYKNDPRIKWHKPLHEQITGATTAAALPREPDYAIIHDKTIERQRAQNEFYNKNWSVQANMGQG